MSEAFDFSGKVALVASVDGDIGSGVAARLSRGGAKLAMVTRGARPAYRVEPPERCLVLGHDVSAEDEIARLVGDVLHAYGRIDLLLIDTGASDDLQASPGSISETSLKDFEAVLASRARPALLALKHVLPAIALADGGAVVCVSSILGSRGHAGMAAEVAAHHAINGMSVVAAKEWAKHGIRVNAVAPAFAVASSVPPAAGAGVGPRDARELADEAAALAAFLLSDDASYLTGSVYPVDRGEAGRTAFNP